MRKNFFCTKKRMTITSTRGFSLVELVIVIGIIGSLLYLSLIVFGNMKTMARDDKRQSDLKILQTAVELYLNDNGSVPDPDATDAWDGADGTRGGLENILANYLPGGLPEDPNIGAPRRWIYCWNTGSGKYMVATSLEQDKKIAGDLDTVSNWGTAECIASDDGAAIAAVPDCDDNKAGEIDDSGANSVTAMCLGSDDN